MNNPIKELWHGNIIRKRTARTNSPEMKELLTYMARHHEELEKSFKNEQKETLRTCLLGALLSFTPMNFYPSQLSISANA